MSLSAAQFAALPLAVLLAVSSSGQEAPAEQQQQKHLVRFSFKAGTVRHSVIEQEMTMTMNMGAEDLVTNIQQKIWTTTTVTAATGNTADIEQKITRIKAFADSIAMKVNYDSDDDDSDPGPLEVLADMVGEMTTMKLSDQGKISEVVMPEDSEALQVAGIDLQEIMSKTVTQLPDHPIAIGETWKVKQKIPLGQLGDTDSEILYKLIAIDKDSITLQQTLVVDMNKLNIPGAAAGMTMKASGSSRIDRWTGSPIEMDLTTTTGMTGAVKMNMKMQQRIRPTQPPKKKAGDDQPTTGEAGKRA